MGKQISESLNEIQNFILGGAGISNFRNKPARSYRRKQRFKGKGNPNMFLVTLPLRS